MSVRMRHTRSHTKNRRSHHALVEPRLSVCSDCGASHLRHHICEKCGRYRGRVVIDVAQKIIKKQKKVSARKEAAQEATKEEEESASTEEAKPLSAESLSKK